MTKKQNYIYAVGRRKTSSVRVRLFKGKGKNLVNEKNIEDYFPGNLDTSLWQAPFKLTDTFEKFYVTAKVVGGGKKAQLEAFVHGVARALSLQDKDKFRVILKKGGFLTRDYRERQRRMVGTGGKSRRAKQSPKR